MCKNVTEWERFCGLVFISFCITKQEVASALSCHITNCLWNSFPFPKLFAIKQVVGLLFMKCKPQTLESLVCRTVCAGLCVLAHEWAVRHPLPHGNWNQNTAWFRIRIRLSEERHGRFDTANVYSVPYKSLLASTDTVFFIKDNNSFSLFSFFHYFTYSLI